MAQGMMTSVLHAMFPEGSFLQQHNDDCYRRLSPFLQDDRRALKWLRKQAERGPAMDPGPAGLFIDWH